MAASFTEQASFSSAGVLNASGRQGIKDFIRGARRQMGLTVHTPNYVHISFEDDGAAAGLVGAHLELAFGDAMVFGAVRYVDHYAREGDRWLISARDMRVIHISPWPQVGEAFASPLPVRWIGAPATASDFPKQDADPRLSSNITEELHGTPTRQGGHHHRRRPGHGRVPRPHLRPRRAPRSC